MTLDQLVAKSLPKTDVEVRYTRNRCILINCIRNGDRVVLRIHQVFRQAPRPVARAVIGLYLKKARAKQIRRDYHTIINEYIDAQEARILRSWEGSVDLTKYPGPHGKHHDLLEIFRRLNDRYFDGELSLFVSWSKSVARRSMGAWLETPPRFKNIITVNPLLDGARVPRYVVEEVMHHEMLHEVIPAIRKNGRKYMHTPEFRVRERAFPHYRRASEWVRKHWDRLHRNHVRRVARRAKSVARRR
jgi:hypothetical protein